jgi:Na+/H+ antiporter NhaD/arsenite permease-like protein
VVAAIAIFATTYDVVAFGRIPGLRIDRTGAALLGGALMVATGAIPLEDAYLAIDWDTIALLLGMMIVVAHLRLAGFFALATAWAVARARYPLPLLAAMHDQSLSPLLDHLAADGDVRPHVALGEQARGAHRRLRLQYPGVARAATETVRPS